MPHLTFRDLTTLDEFAAVVDLERRIWGVDYGDVVPVPIFAVTVMRGAILIGAFEDGRMIAFVYSIAGIKDGRAMQWSHMLGVADDHRQRGLGHRLKLMQRERAIAMDLDLIEWTFDPMQAANAHLNFAKLGIVVEEYEVNVYGQSASPLHGGNPTDRFIAEWWIRKPHVERRVVANAPFVLRSNEVADAVPVNRTKPAGAWHEPVAVDLSLDARRLIVTIPMEFTDMLSRAPDLALTWRLTTREIFQTYFARGYRAVEFVLDRADGTGAYLLARETRA